jgi:hypothetical protein
LYVLLVTRNEREMTSLSGSCGLSSVNVARSIEPVPALLKMSTIALSVMNVALGGISISFSSPGAPPVRTT